jgi:hypothetical protein
MNSQDCECCSHLFVALDVDTDARNPTCHRSLRLPTIPTSRLEGNLEEEKAAATPTKTQPPRQVSHGPSNLSGKSPAVSFMETSFPNIKALTSATPGKNQRSQLQSHSIMMTTLHSPFEAVSLSSTRDFQAINNSLCVSSLQALAPRDSSLISLI